jgi:hypothetical protein
VVRGPGPHALPDDDQLIADITTPTYSAMGAKYVVERKDEVRKRIGRSPDLGDALSYCLWIDPPGKRAPRAHGGRPQVVQWAGSANLREIFPVGPVWS